jgi:hypothetical protein
MLLPLELQQKIVREVMRSEIGRLVHVDETPLYVDANITLDQGRSFVLRRLYSSQIEVFGATAPNMAIAIAGVAEYIVEAGIYKPLFRTGFSNSTVLFNEKVDMVVLRSTYSNFGTPPRLLFASCLTNPCDLSAVRRLMFDVDKLLSFHRWTADNFNSFMNLEDLQLVGEYLDKPKVGEKFLLQMSFKPCWDLDGLRDATGRLDVRRGMRPCTTIDRISYHNHEAFSAAYGHIVDTSEHQRVMDIYAILNDMAQSGVNVPETKLEILYVPGILTAGSI